MKQKIFLLTFFILFIPLVLAGTIATDKSVYSLGETVKISGTCPSSSTPVAFQLQFGEPANTVWVNQVNTDATNNFSVNYIAQNNGNNSLYYACQGETAAKTTFCVGTATECPTTTPSSDATPTPIPTPGPSPGGGGSGGNYCNPVYSCGNWNNCNASLKQSRLCADTKNCKPSYTEYKNCTQCDESWDCSLWSECKNGKQLRTCIDNYYCKTTLKKPALEKLCTQTIASGPAPAQINQQIPPPVVTAITEELSFWDNYKWFIILTPLALILIGVITYLILHFKKPKAYNINELKNWIQQEKQAGTPDTDIKQILAQQTGWRDDEISRAFRGLAS